MEQTENQTEATRKCLKCNAETTGDSTVCSSCEKLRREEAARKIAVLTQVVGITGGVILIIMGLATDTGKYDYKPDWMTVLYGVVCVLSAMVIWAVIMMLVNISQSLKNND